MADTILLSVVAFLVCGLVMGLGVLLNRKSRCMRQGTCGRDPVEVGGVRLTCGACPNRDENAGEPESACKAPSPSDPASVS